ncbi:alpha/beta fold hydrolase [Arsukibacterium sp.]|uniref:alpha/beta fold hydrolase n=1 Tax=Arsukibacterium sp. TaxID=1977258 RepID=UPI002FD8B866
MILHSQCSGQGPDLVLIHGLFGSYENLGVIARALSDAFRIINIDVRNHGRSDHSEHMNYALMATDVADTLDALGVSQCAMLGHSMGGKLAMAFALRYPERVTKLILADIAPVAYPPRHNAVFAGLQQVQLASITSRSDADKQLAAHINEPGVRQFLLKSLDKTEQGFAWRFNLAALKANYPALIGDELSNSVEHSNTPAQFNGPTLFIKGGDSDYILTEHRPAIMARFPNAQAKIIQGTGHWLHAEKPAAFSKLVRDFLLS